MGAKDYTANFTLITYTISYDLGGGSLPAGYTVSYDVTSNNFTLPNPTKTGYDFTGWTLSGDTTGASPSTNVTITKNSTGDRHYIANWTPTKYTITYTLNDGTATNPASYTIESPDIKLNNPTKTGYDFKGWTGSNGTTAQTTVTIPKGSTGAKDYTANFTLITYTISYDLGGGSLPAGYTVGYDVTSNDFTLSQPTREGYTFTGWTLSGDTAEATTSLTISHGTTGDRTYIANWKAVIYTLSYDLKAGSLSQANPLHYTIESPDFTLNNPAKDHQKFTGWTLSGDTAEATTSLTIPQGSTGNRTYIANWEDYTNKYTLTIPEAFSITGPGWNPTDGITVSADTPGCFDPAKKIVIDATSASGFFLVPDRGTDPIAYTVMSQKSDTEQTIHWEFTGAEVNAKTNKPVGIYVNPYATMRPAVYKCDLVFKIDSADID